MKLSTGKDLPLGIRLKELDVPRLGRDDARSDGAGEVKGVAHGQDPIAHLQVVAVAPFQGGEVFRIDAEHCDVSGRVAADEHGFQGSVVIEPHLDFVRSVDDVVVGYDEPSGVQDDTTARSALEP